MEGPISVFLKKSNTQKFLDVSLIARKMQDEVLLKIKKLNTKEHNISLIQAHYLKLDASTNSERYETFRFTVPVPQVKIVSQYRNLFIFFYF